MAVFPPPEMGMALIITSKADSLAASETLHTNVDAGRASVGIYVSVSFLEDVVRGAIQLNDYVASTAV